MKKISVSSAFLKNIAYTSMLIDHFFAVVFLAYYYWLRDMGEATEGIYEIYRIGRALGRPAFVFFAFMAMEGFCHTRNVGKYLLRLGIFAFLSEIPFDLALKGALFAMSGQNVYFTLFLGVLALWMIEKLYKYPILQFSAVVLCCVAAAFLKTDYMFMGVLLIVVFYVFRESFLLQFLTGSVTVYAGIVMVYMVRYWGQGRSMNSFLQSGLRELYGLAAFVVIYFYNGKKGKQLPKMCYYLFYPLHLLCLYWIKLKLFG